MFKIVARSTLVVACAGLLSLASCGGAQSAPTHTMAPASSTSPQNEEVREMENKRIVRQIYEECLAHGKMELLQDIISPDFENPVGGKGPDAFADVLQSIRFGFPDLELEVDAALADGNQVAIRFRYTGTHTGRYRFIPPTGKRVETTGLSLYTLENGRVVAVELETDRLGFLQQLGVLPEDLSSLRTAD